MKSRPRISIVLAMLAWMLPLAARGASFGVSPIRLDLDPASRTGLVTVSNEDAKRIYFRLKLAEWKQGAEGDDSYADSSDLIYFPQTLVIEPKEKRVVRVGIKGPPPVAERAFRLYIEELPDPDEPAPAGTAVAVRLRFGVPIFLSQGKGAPKPEMVSAASTKGAVRVAIRNSGDRQIRFEEVTLTLGPGGKALGRIPGWYVFPGATRAFVVPVDRASCPLSGAIEVRAFGEGKDLRRSVEADRLLCSS